MQQVLNYLSSKYYDKPLKLVLELFQKFNNNPHPASLTIPLVPDPIKLRR